MPARTMSQLENTSAILGEYMLKGWTLTDLHCETCRVTPLMREPAAPAEREGRDRVQFCALCDGRPDGAAAAPAASSSFVPPAPASSGNNAQAMAGSSISSSFSAPTPAAQTFDSPFGPIPASNPSSSSSRQPRLAPPHNSHNSVTAPVPAEVEPAAHPTDEIDVAEQISSLLLRGYSLLSENCPSSNPLCRGVPLVGYPRQSDGKKDGRKLCVSCGSRWVEEKFVSAESGLRAVPRSGAGAGAGAGGKRENEKGLDLSLSPRTRARNELYGLGSSGDSKGKEKSAEHKHGVQTVHPDAFAESARRSAKELEGRDADVDRELELELESPNLSGEERRDMSSSFIPTSPSKANSSPLAQALSRTSSSLANTLQSLSASLERHVAQPQPFNSHGAGAGTGAGRWFVDLKLHTEAIKDVLGVVEQVERARRM